MQKKYLRKGSKNIKSCMRSMVDKKQKTKMEKAFNGCLAIIKC